MSDDDTDMAALALAAVEATRGLPRAQLRAILDCLRDNEAWALVAVLAGAQALPFDGSAMREEHE